MYVCIQSKLFVSQRNALALSKNEVFTLQLGCSYLRPPLKPHVNVLFSTRVQEQEGEKRGKSSPRRMHEAHLFLLFFLRASAPLRCSAANQCINRNHCLTHLLTSCIWD